MKLTPTYRLCGLGAVMLVALVLCARQFGGQGEAFPILPLTIAGIAYLLALRELFCTPQLSRYTIVAGLLLAAVWQVAFLSIPTGSDDDVRRYVWDGRIQRLGYNPYIVVPDDPAFAGLHTDETRAMNHSDLPSLYPPGAELFFRVVTAIHESTLALRIAFVICSFVVTLVLLDVLRLTGQGEHWILVYAWNPLLATAVAGSGHIDIVGVLLLLVSVAALLRRRQSAAAIAFALAISIKPLPIVLLPLYWRRVRLRDALAGSAVLVILHLPFLDNGRIPIGSLGTYVQSFRFNDPVFAAVARIVSPHGAAAIAVLAGIAVAIWGRIKAQTLTGDAVAWPMAASLLCAPVIYPWYLLWMLPFARSLLTLPILVWTVSILPAYLVWHLRELGHPWGLPGWVLILEYGSFAITLAIVLHCRVRRSDARGQGG